MPIVKLHRGRRRRKKTRRAVGKVWTARQRTIDNSNNFTASRGKKRTMMSERIQQSNRSGDHCHRCGGLMVQEFVHATGSYEWRCVMCGEHVDEVILAHRREREAREAPQKLFAVAV